MGSRVNNHNYSITGGTDSFNDATRTFNAVFDSNDFSYYWNIEIHMCFIFPEVGDAVQCMNGTDGEEITDTHIYCTTSSNKIQYYPNGAVAFSWGEDWHYNRRILIVPA